MALTLVTAAAVLPVTVAEVEAQVRETLSTAESALVTTYIGAVTAKGEAILKRSIITQTWKVELDDFPDSISLPMGPVQSVTSVTYLDDDGDRQTLAETVYQFVNDQDRPRIILAYDQEWESCRVQPGSIVVTYVAGYGLAVSVPAAIKAWILVNVATLYNNRESIVVGSMVKDISTIADGLLDGHMVTTF
ncbi:MAG: hypothetical protein KJ630_19075 [Proteobacteria bacterium]|nr:hypothetical protein [Pseudomonadota bacterium]